jgi:hypothetical protein
MQKYVNTRLSRLLSRSRIPPAVGAYWVLDREDFSFDDVCAHPSWNWNFMDMHIHPKFDPDWVRRLPNKPWNWRKINDFSLVLEFPNKAWDWVSLSRDATIEQIVQHPGLPWHWDIVTIMSAITLDDISRHPELPWDIHDLAFTGIEADEIKYIRVFKDRLAPECWADFSQYVTLQLALDNIDLPWHWNSMRFKLEDYTEKLSNHIDLIGVDEWNWIRLSECAPFEFVAKHAEYPWYWNLLRPLEFTDELAAFIQSGGMVPDWNWSHLSSVAGVDMVLKYKHFPWDVSMVADIEYKHIAELEKMGELDYLLVPSEPVEDCIRKWHSACVIQRHWREATTNPASALCRKLVTEMNEDVQERIKATSLDAR